LFVFPSEFKDHANQLYLALKNGIGPFQGTERLLDFSLSASQVVRLPDFSIGSAGHPEAAERYRLAIEQYVERMDATAPPDLALIIHPRTSRSEHDTNPYLTARFPLLMADVPTQTVTTDLMGRPDLFQWSVGNIALAMFAKMGGQPWAVESDLGQDTLIVGINRVNIARSGESRRARLYGFASTFSHDGLYLYTTLFPPAHNWDEYITGLRTALRSSIEAWHREFKTPVNLVLHVSKDLHTEEVTILEETLAAATPGPVRSYSVLKLNDGQNMLIFSRAAPASIPPPGVIVSLAGHRALLQIGGQEPSDRAVGKHVVASPWHVTLTKQSPNAPSFHTLCCNVLALGAMNWRGLNAEATPVSMEYPAEVAELLGRFEEAGFPASELNGRSIMRRVWFI
jgi:hypothetical protein